MRMKDSFKQAARYGAATVVLLLGVAGLFLPFLQGILLILLALVMFGVIERKDIARLKQRWDEWRKK